MAKNVIDSADLLNFLKASLFGSEYAEQVLSDNGKIELAINRAYRDMNRTLNTKDNPQIWEDRKKDVRMSLIELISEANISKIQDQTLFDQWHMQLCEVITCNNYYTFGQAQKWINMTLKYLLVLDYKPIFSLIPFLHVPIDEIIVKIAKKEKCIKAKLSDYLPWSKKLSSEAEDNYELFQNGIRDNVKDLYPIQWEFKAWNKGSSNKA